MKMKRRNTEGDVFQKKQESKKHHTALENGMAVTRETDTPRCLLIFLICQHSIRRERYPVIPSICRPCCRTALVACRTGSTTICTPAIRICTSSTKRTGKQFIFLDITFPDSATNIAKIGTCEFHTPSDPDTENDQEIKRHHKNKEKSP